MRRAAIRQRFEKAYNMNDRHPIVHKTEHFIIRATENEDGELDIFVHRIDQETEAELSPRGYMLGYNSLHMGIVRK
jgi:hypothetical protein